MSKFYIVKDAYFPNTAACNRLHGFLKEFSNQGITCEVTFFMADYSYSLAPELPFINYCYYWKLFKTKNRYLRQFLYLFVYIFLFAWKVKEGDTVLLLNCDELVSILTKKKGVRVFQERTEHTDYSRNKFISYQKYFQACNKLSGLFLISNNLKHHYVEHGVNPEIITIINMTVDASRFEKVQKQPNELRYIAYCGTASNNKDGVNDLIKAFAIVSKKRPGIKLYIIGATPSSSDESGNLKLINDLGIKEDVLFTGVVSSSMMPQLLKNATILALDRPDNKQAKYGFPTKLGEYLLTGNPVVLTRVGNMPDFLTDGKDALFANCSDESDFSSKLIALLDNSSLALSIGESGRQVALREFDSAIETKKMIKKIF